jgi:Flp pilus assembly protein TadG
MRANIQTITEVIPRSKSEARRPAARPPIQPSLVLRLQYWLTAQYVRFVTDHEVISVRPNVRSRKASRGSAVLEFALVSPLLFFFMLVTFDFGLYTYAFIAVQNGVRAAALRNSSGLDSAADANGACAIVLGELQGLPNTGGATACSGSPVTVTATLECWTDCAPGVATPDGQPASLVTVKYTMPPVFQLHLAGTDTITRSAEMKIRSIQ